MTNSIGAASFALAPVAFPDRSAMSVMSSGQSAALSVGYGRIEAQSGPTPAGVAIFGYRSNNVLVTEASVPASPLITSGRCVCRGRWNRKHWFGDLKSQQRANDRFVCIY